MSGQVSGLDFTEVSVRLGRPLTEQDTALLNAIETGGLIGFAKKSDEAGDVPPENEED